MSLLTTHAIIDRIERTASFHVAGAGPLHERELQSDWQEIIDYKLIDWGQNPAQFDDDDTEGPKPPAIRAACQFARFFQEQQVRVPSWVVPSGVGGVTFSWGEHGREIDSLEIDAFGKATFIRMKASQILERELVAIPE